MMLQSSADLKKTPSRIVSLVPSQTELLHWLGLENETIAITKFCVHPSKWQASKIIIGGTKNIRTAQIKDLHPHLVIANKEENVKEQVEDLAQDFPVWLTDVNDLNGALQMIRDVGSLTNTGQKAEALATQIAAGFLQLPLPERAIPTAYLVWRNPYMTVGGDTFINDMLRHCGMQNIFAGSTRYPETSLAAIKDAG